MGDDQQKRQKQQVEGGKVALAASTLTPGHWCRRTGPVRPGGVMVPIARLKIIMLPKCTGTYPAFWAMGGRMGVKNKLADPMSMTHPTTSNSRLMISITIPGPSEMGSMNAVSVAGIPVKDMLKLSDARISMIAPVMWTVSIRKPCKARRRPSGSSR